MASNASRGAAAKARTKKWLIAQGYQVADMEVVRWIIREDTRIPVKHDQLGSDLLAVSGTSMIFIQVKSGEAARGGRFPDARREFAKFVFPPASRQFVVAWPPRARAPRLVNCTVRKES